MIDHPQLRPTSKENADDRSQMFGEFVPLSGSADQLQLQSLIAPQTRHETPLETAAGEETAAAILLLMATGKHTPAIHGSVDAGDSLEEHPKFDATSLYPTMQWSFDADGNPVLGEAAMSELKQQGETIEKLREVVMYYLQQDPELSPKSLGFRILLEVQHTKSDPQSP